MLNFSFELYEKLNAAYQGISEHAKHGIPKASQMSSLVYIKCPKCVQFLVKVLKSGDNCENIDRNKGKGVRKTWPTTHYK